MLPGWIHRKLITLTKTYAVANLTNFIVPIPVTYSTEMNPNFSDIRFTAADGTTLLSFGFDWNDDGTDIEVNNTSATFLVKIPSWLAASTTITIYMYYGNGAATSVANTESLSDVAHGNFFDGFSTDRSAEYTHVGGSWDTANSQVKFSVANDYIYPTGLSEKNLKMKFSFWVDTEHHGYLYSSEGALHLRYRYTAPTTDWDFWRYHYTDNTGFGFRVDNWYKDLTLVNTATHLMDGAGYWTTHHLTAYETEHSLTSAVVLNYTWADVSTVQNVAGTVRITNDYTLAFPFYTAIGCLYVRQYINEEPTAAFGPEETFGQTDFSWAFWFKINNNPSTDLVFYWIGTLPASANGSITTLYFGKPSGPPVVWVWNTWGHPNFLSSKVGLDDGAWHHLIVTHEGLTGNVQFYTDGVLTDTFLATGTLNLGTPANIDFMYGPLAGPSTDETIDEVNYWKGHILTASEAAILYAGGVGKYLMPITPGITPATSIWHLDEGVGLTAVDVVAGNNLILTAPTWVPGWVQEP